MINNAVLCSPQFRRKLKSNTDFRDKAERVTDIEDDGVLVYRWLGINWVFISMSATLKLGEI